uniref:Photosynthesis system II assembly factor Ycf48/Hcf136-like domain-containing protein n=1 Tax=Candidatus Kentrum sp. TUN TaxID=2126343 RepID=A0A450ZBJ7_9GAMM|nr:MAG: Uncharacterized protein BECKTUN1418D_GA0071000_10064 [Candidatus Kentron sp. TUN]
MNGLRSIYPYLFAALLIATSGHNSARGGTRLEDPSYAWHSPLATRSLLLAIGKSDRIVAVGERGHILYRQGAGEWRQAQVPTRILLTGLSFSDDRHGFAVGHDALILATLDGGQTWHKVHEAIEEERPLLDIRFRDNRFGIAVGAYGYLLKTKDGGANWYSSLVDKENDFHLNAIAITPDGRIYLAAEAGYVYRSDDEEDSWRILSPPYDGSFFGIYPTEGDKVMVFGLRGHLFVSEDAGEHWRSLDTGTRATLTSAIGLGNGQFLLTGHGGTLLLVDSHLRQVRHARLPERKAFSDAMEIASNRVLLVGEEGTRTLDLCDVFSRDVLSGCEIIPSLFLPDETE